MWFCQPMKRLEEILVSFFHTKNKKEGVKMENISIALACTLLGAVLSFLTFQRNKGHDIRADTREEAETKAKLDYISKGVDDIKIDFKVQQREMQELKERVIKNEESTKSAHKRIDAIERGEC